jgi:hypothetical protein
LQLKGPKSYSGAWEEPIACTRISSSVVAPSSRNFAAPSALFRRMEQISNRQPKALTSEERKARDAARRAEAEQAMREHRTAQKAFHENHDRLKAERLAREAAREREAARRRS